MFLNTKGKIEKLFVWWMTEFICLYVEKREARPSSVYIRVQGVPKSLKKMAGGGEEKMYISIGQYT